MLWSETVRTPEQFDYMIFPRMLAYAERAWHRADWELPYTAGRTFSSTSGLVNKTALAQDYAEFAAALGQKELAKLDAAGGIRPGMELTLPPSWPQPDIENVED